MRTPPLLLGAAVLFWGFQTGIRVVDVLIACVLEGSRLVPWRYELSRESVRRIRNLCILILAILAVYVLSTVELLRAFLVIFSLYPVAVLPLMVAHVYSTGDAIDARLLFLLPERLSGPAPTVWAPRIDPSYPYLAILILASAAANVRVPWFYLGLCLLAAWALWACRPKRYPVLVWGVLLGCVFLLGYGGHQGLAGLQRVLEGELTRWLSDSMGGGETDPGRAHTAIGRLGTLKLSDAIVLRVEAAAGEEASFLLHEAGYNRYASSIWSASDSSFAALQPEGDGTTWTLDPGARPSRRLTIFASLPRGRGSLPVPYGTSRLEQLVVGSVERNQYGALQARAASRRVGYQAFFVPGAADAAPPDEADLRVPPKEASVLSRVAAELGLATLPPHQALSRLADFFEKNYRYSLFQGDRPLGSSALEDFLLRTRSGHCEYFATATALLLRTAGIPARYATGYSVQEFSRLENRYVVRARHAHAWALAYVDGAWRVLDTTPASWAAVEEEAASWWAPLSDLWSWGAFQVAAQWERLGGVGSLRYVGWLLIPLALFLLWRLFSGKRLAGLRRRGRCADGAPRWPGADSEFYEIERRLGKQGLGRHPGEPLLRWVERIEALRILPGATAPLCDLVSLHYRYRFDPKGISPPEREALRSGILSWLGQDALKGFRA